MKRLFSLLVPLSILLAAIGPGCYTVIQHPVSYNGERAHQTSDCTSCHADYAQFPYGYYYSPYPSYWWDYPSYSSYYAYPWWWSYYYNSASQQADENAVTDQETTSDQDTKFDRREGHRLPMAPPYSLPDGSNSDWPTGPGVYNLPSGSTTTQPSTGSGKGTTATRGKDQDSTQTNTKEVRQTTPQTTDNQTKVDNSKASEKPKDTQTKKKSRRD